jgi:hypothetical protein
MARKRTTPHKQPADSQGATGLEPVEKAIEIPAAPLAKLVIADLAMKAGAYALRSTIDKHLLKQDDGKEAAKQIGAKRVVGKQVATRKLAKIATGSAIGAAVVGTGLLAKNLFDRGGRRLKASRADGTATAPIADE